MGKVCLRVWSWLGYKTVMPLRQFIQWCLDILFVLCSLIYESGLKQRLLRYAASALLFTQKGVNPNLVSWNRWETSVWFFHYMLYLLLFSTLAELLSKLSLFLSRFVCSFVSWSDALSRWSLFNTEVLMIRWKFLQDCSFARTTRDWQNISLQSIGSKAFNSLQL